MFFLTTGPEEKKNASFDEKPLSGQAQFSKQKTGKWKKEVTLKKDAGICSFSLGKPDFPKPKYPMRSFPTAFCNYQ